MSTVFQNKIEQKTTELLNAHEKGDVDAVKILTAEIKALNNLNAELHNATPAPKIAKTRAMPKDKKPAGRKIYTDADVTTKLGEPVSIRMKYNQYADGLFVESFDVEFLVLGTIQRLVNNTPVSYTALKCCEDKAGLLRGQIIGVKVLKNVEYLGN